MRIPGIVIAKCTNTHCRPREAALELVWQVDHPVAASCAGCRCRCTSPGGAIPIHRSRKLSLPGCLRSGFAAGQRRLDRQKCPWTGGWSRGRRGKPPSAHHWIRAINQRSLPSSKSQDSASSADLRIHQRRAELYERPRVAPGFALTGAVHLAKKSPFRAENVIT